MASMAIAMTPEFNLPLGHRDSELHLTEKTRTTAGSSWGSCRTRFGWWAGVLPSLRFGQEFDRDAVNRSSNKIQRKEEATETGRLGLRNEMNWVDLELCFKSTLAMQLDKYRTQNNRNTLVRGVRSQLTVSLCWSRDGARCFVRLAWMVWIVFAPVTWLQELHRIHLRPADYMLAEAWFALPGSGATSTSHPQIDAVVLTNWYMMDHDGVPYL